MGRAPERPKIYHITHVRNLQAIASEGLLVCDREIMSMSATIRGIGMSAIKRRRLEEIEVPCRPGTKVGDYVPFYFCPRSVMLYVIHCANHPELTYRGGQEPIVHLEADLHQTVRWAMHEDRAWAFSLSNAGSYYAQFRSHIDDLEQLDWDAIAARDFRASEIKEAKQAEFLVYECFPFALVERIGVKSLKIRAEAAAAIASADHQPRVQVLPDWYF